MKFQVIKIYKFKQNFINRLLFIFICFWLWVSIKNVQRKLRKKKKKKKGKYTCNCSFLKLIFLNFGISDTKQKIASVKWK